MLRLYSRHILRQRWWESAIGITCKRSVTVSIPTLCTHDVSSVQSPNVHHSKSIPITLYQCDSLGSGIDSWGDYCNNNNSIQSQKRYLSTTSRQQRQQKRIPRMSEMRSLEEALTATYDNLDGLSPRDVSAFWAVVPKFLGGRGPRTNQQQQQQMFHQFDKISTKSIQDLNQYGYRELATLAISLAKIIDKISKRKRPAKGNPRQILQEVLIGNEEAKIKQYIFREIAAASVPILHEFEPRHLSNLIYAYGLSQEVALVEGGSTFFDMLAKVAIPNLDKFNGQGLSNMLWSYANVKVPNSQLYVQAGDSIVAMNNLNEFWPQALSNIIWAYATLDEQHTKLFEKIANHIVTLNSLDRYEPQALSNIIWAFATADESHPKLFKKVGDHMVRLPNLNKFEPQAMKDILWSYATAGESHSNLFKKVADHIVGLDILDRYDSQALSNTLWAFAKAKYTHPELYKKVADHIVQLPNLNEFKPQALKDIVWAYATAGETHSKLFKKVADYIITLDSLDEFWSQTLSNTVWAYATASESHPNLFKKLADEAIKRQHDFKPQELANFLWAHATNGQVDKHLFSSLIPSVKANLVKFNEQELLNVAWAYSVANVDAPSVFNSDFIKCCQQKEDEFELEALRQLHQWQFWQDEIKSDIDLPSSLQKKCHEAFISRDPRPSNLQDDVVSSLSSMGLQVEEEVLLKSGYRIDAVVRVNEKKIAVEVDGPSHFIGRELTGSTILKHRQVASVDGMRVVSVPYWEWNKLKNHTEKKKQYLQYLLGI